MTSPDEYTVPDWLGINFDADLIDYTDIHDYVWTEEGDEK